MKIKIEIDESLSEDEVADPLPRTDGAGHGNTEGGERSGQHLAEVCFLPG